MPKETKWEEEFDEKFCRLDKSPEKKGRMDSWFLQDHIIGKDIKQFISKTLAEEKKKLIEKVEDFLINEELVHDTDDETIDKLKKLI